MPYPNWHAARMIQPSRFEKDSFRTKAIDKGITIIVGRLKGQDKTATQTYRFDKDEFTADKAKKWMGDHKLNFISFEPATGDEPQAKKVNAFVSLITSDVQALSLSQSEIMAMIPGETLRDIKRRDPHPFFKAYSIAHEGYSTPKFLDTKTKPIRWFPKAIQTIKSLALKGIKFFVNHGKTNETAGREPVGEVVADGQRTINGIIHHLAVGYFPDKSKVQAMDICSQEAEWSFFNYAKEYVARAVNKITAIALSDSRYDEPAFPEARAVGMIQAFSNEGKKEKKMPDKIELNTVSLDEIISEIKRRQIVPTQVFAVEEIMKVKEVQAAVSETNTLKETVKEKEAQIETLKTEKSELARKTAATSAKERLDAVMKELKATDKQSEYVTRRFKKVAEKMEDLTDAGLKKFVEDCFDSFADAQPEVSDEGTTGSPPPKNTDDSTEKDYTLPENNEFIEETPKKE